jgi:hypothetical protein
MRPAAERQTHPHQRRNTWHHFPSFHAPVHLWVSTEGCCYVCLGEPRRVASLVPPPRANLTRFHGVFAPGAKLRLFLVPPAGEEEARAGKEAAARTERMKQRTPREDWAELLRRTFDFDVFACVRCGGRRGVSAYVKGARGVRAILKHLGLPTAGARLAPARGPHKAAWR